MKQKYFLNNLKKGAQLVTKQYKIQREGSYEYEQPC